MRLLYLLILFSIFAFDVHGQNSKPVLDTGATIHWQKANFPSLSFDGKYAGYLVQSGYNSSQLILKRLDDGWKMASEKVARYEFAREQNFAVYLSEDGNLTLVKLGGTVSDSVQGVIEFKLLNIKGRDKLVYGKIDRSLVLSDLMNGRKKIYKDVENWALAGLNKILVSEKSKNGETLSIIDLIKMQATLLGEYGHVENVVCDKTGRWLAFVAKDADMGIYVISYDAESNKIVHNVKIDDQRKITSLERISSDGNLLFARFADRLPNKQSTDNVTVWKYTDVKLQSQLRKESNKQQPLEYFNFSSGKWEVIEGKGEQAGFLNADERMMHIALQEGDAYEAQWNLKSKARHYLYYLPNKRRYEITFHLISRSPDGKYVLGTETDRDSFQQIILYDVNTGIKQTLVLGKDNDLSIDSTLAHNDRESYSFVGWRERVAYFYDAYDIWKIDLASSRKLKSVTNGFGRRTGIVLRFGNELENEVISETSLLLARNTHDQSTGYFKLNKEGLDPVLLSMDSYYYNSPGDFNSYDFLPVKALKADVWLVSREKSSESKNYFFTKDFRKFRPITYVYPERAYNWMTSKVVNFKTISGDDCKAVVYIPEDFDSTKRYPVIINYYEHLSYFDNYIQPYLSSNSINVPWFVSRGYIVCKTDIKYKKGETGQSALNAVEGLAKYLSGFSYVDSMGIGIQGHSFGGYETNYIVTHSQRFAAAISASGYSDLISDVNSIRTQYGGNFQANRTEVGQGRLGYTLWQRPDIYIENSPIFAADKVKTPLLIMHNPNDNAVNFTQGLEFFIALRRLQRRVWMLEYKDEGHSLRSEANKYDYTTKMDEFFGHYLKRQPMPDWMKPQNAE